MTPEDKKNLSEAIKNIVMAAAVCVAGVWAYYSFDARLEAQNAEAKLEILNNELIQRPIILSTIDVSVKKDETRKSWLILANVRIKNKGKKRAEIGVADGSLRVAKAVMENGVVSEYKNRIYAEMRVIPDKDQKERPYNYASSIHLLQGSEKSLKYIVEVNEPGIYLLDFSGTPSKEIVAARGKGQFAFESQYVASREFILIK